MPTYSYACAACAHRFDAFQSIHDDALTVCPECGGEVRRVISAVGVSFKGSGFYRTDSRTKSTSSLAASSTATTSGSDAPASAPVKAPTTSAAADPS